MAEDTSQARGQALLDAVISLGSDLDLEQVLQRIVVAACRLSDARYGALAVLGEAGLDQFVTEGVSPEQRRLIGPPPRGHGLLGVVIKDPRPLRLERITDHPASTGLPPHHPPMTTFLGVPIRIGDAVFGNLYLSGKTDGSPFDAQDEQAVVTLAAAAGVAVAQARLYEESERRRRWVEASAQITAATLGRLPRAQVLALVAQRVRQVAGAVVSVLAVLGEESGPAAPLFVEVVDRDDRATRGGPAVPAPGARLPRSGAVAEVLATAQPRTVADLHGDPALTALLPDADHRLGPALVVPVLATASGARPAVLVAVWPAGARGATEQDAVSARALADQAALALDRVQAEADRAELAVLADRHRIARDLHDVVIQRLFATGLGLQVALRHAERDDVRERIEATVEDLDGTIRDIRSTIFALNRPPDDHDLRGEVLDLVSEQAEPLGFRPTLVIDGPLEHGVPTQLRPHLLAVLRELLSNAARHAGATQVQVTLSVRDGRLRISVRDDGRGIMPGGRRSGLRNLEVRAETAGGTLRVTGPPEGGTLARWDVPLD